MARRTDLCAGLRSGRTRRPPARASTAGRGISSRTVRSGRTAPALDTVDPTVAQALTHHPGCRLGVLAFGDSITNGGGELQWGVALQSWALWTARALGLPYTSYAVDGARVTGVVEEQIPAFQRRSVHPQARYELGCIYIGTNDARALDWD